MKLSVIIPAYNEEESITETIDQIQHAFASIKIEHEIFVVNDNSKDNTLQVLETLAKKYRSLKYETNRSVKIALLPAFGIESEYLKFKVSFFNSTIPE